MNNSAVAYRILDPKLTLTGASGDALENEIVDPLPDGSVCWVIAEAGFWFLNKYSLATPGADVIATSKGAGVRGRWIRVGTSGSGFEPTFAQIVLSSGAFTLGSSGLWQAMPTSETTYSALLVQDIDINGNTFTLNVAQPAGRFFCRAILSWFGDSTEEADILRMSLALSKNGDLIGQASDAVGLGRQTTSALYFDTTGEPGEVVVAERMVALVPGDTMQGIVLAESVVGNAQVAVRNYSFTIERLSTGAEP